MTDIAELGMRVTAPGAETASGSLRKVAGSAHMASMASNELSFASKNLKMAMMAIAPMGIAVAVAFAGFKAVSSAATQARDFGAALDEVSTLTKGTPEQMDKISASARRMGIAYGTGAVAQVKGFYQAISAGATTAEAATRILESANKLAIGGVTDTTTAVNILTTAVNAYSKTGLTAAQASDAMFVAIKDGKTTAAELSTALGRVIPFASSLGITFGELTAAVAALTTQGQSTPLAVTGIRASLVGILKPAKDAKDLAKSLGIEFNAAGLKTKGFAGFMADVVKKTNGSQEAMTRLFGSTEALTAVIAFAGTAGEKLAKINGDMANKAGATDTAFRKMADGADQRLKVATSTLSDAMLSFGNGIIIVVTPAVEGLAFVVREISDHIVLLGSFAAATGLVMVVAFAPSMVGAAVAMWGFVASVVAANLSLTALRGAMMMTGIGAIIVGLGTAIYYFIELSKRAGGVGIAMGMLSDVADDVWGRISDGGYAVGLAIWSLGLSIQATWAKAMANMTTGWGYFVQAVAGAAFTIPGMSGIAQGLQDRSDAIKASVKAMKSDVKDLNDAASNIGKQSEILFGTLIRPLKSIAVIKDLFNKGEMQGPPMQTSVPSIGGGYSAGSAATAAQAEATKASAAAQKEAAKLYDETRTAAEKYAISVAHLNELNSEGVLKIGVYDRAMRNLRVTYNKSTEGGKLYFDSVKQIKQGMIDAIVSGKNLGSVLANVAKRLAEAAAQALLFGDGPFGSKGGNGLLGGFFKNLLGFANGTNNAPGGMAIVGERGPELVNLPRGSQVIPNEALRAAGGQQAPTQININVTGARGNQEIQQMVADGVKAGIGIFNQHVLPIRVQQIANDPLRTA